MRSRAWLGCERIEVAECGSTNDLALERARAGAPHGAVIIADAQVAGRGRLGRIWASPPGRNLYMSAVVRTGLPLARIAPITLAVGIGVCDAIRAEGVTAAALKWPNDVVAERRKLGGILCEGAGADVVVVGIGINLNGAARDFPPEIAARATTIADQLGRIVDRQAFTDRLLVALEPWLDKFLAGGIAAVAAPWEQRMARDLRLRIETGAGAVISGEAMGLDGDGGLRLRDDTGVVHRVMAGEIAIQ